MEPWGTIYLVQPDWDGDDADMDQAAVEAYEPAKSFFDVAIELWQLAGDVDRSATVERLLEQVYSRKRCWMTATEIKEFLRLLEGLEDALVGTVVDENWRVTPEQLPRLRACTETLDLGESRGEAAFSGVAEGIAQVCSLRSILREAVDRGLLISLD